MDNSEHGLQINNKQIHFFHINLHMFSCGVNQSPDQESGPCVLLTAD